MNRGFAPIILVIVILAILAMVGVGAFVLGRSDISLPQLSQQKEGDLSSGVKATGSKYKTVPKKPTGWFTTGQDADMMLSGIDFNNTGGPLLFNHPGNIASDGQRLLLADRNNNRVLIWNKLPTGNTPPDIVLGQKNFTTNNPGTGLDNLNWPVAVATAGDKIIVGDTTNDRILIWNSFPTKSGQPADLELKGGDPDQMRRLDKATASKQAIGWPWAVWTNGQKMIVASTGTGTVLIWNSFPKQNNQPADIVLTANNQFGTPRSIVTDGQGLMIGDHNAKVNNGRGGNYFWKTWPAKNDQPYDFFVAEPVRMGERRGPAQDGQGGEVMWGGLTDDGQLVAITNRLYIWKTFPVNENAGADLKIGGSPGNSGYDFGGGQAGDGTGIVATGGKLYISLSNGNKIVGFNTFPTTADAKPDFAIGSPDIYTNTLATNYIITNGVPATNGKSLFVSSDFDRKLYVWKNLPDESGAKPDYVYPYGGWDNDLYGQTFAQAGYRELYIWKTLPTEGQPPDIAIKDRIGSIEFQELRGVAIDEKYFYLADSRAGKVYIFEDIPDKSSSPKFTLSVNEARRLSSDGKYLVVTTTLDNQTGHVKFFPIANLSDDAKPIILNRQAIPTNLPEYAVTSGGHLFIADTGFHRVLVWNNIQDALGGQPADTILGESNSDDHKPELGINKVFWPSGLAFDGSFLWVGEFKFSGRILRFSVH